MTLQSELRQLLTLARKHEPVPQRRLTTTSAPIRPIQRGICSTPTSQIGQSSESVSA